MFFFSILDYCRCIFFFFLFCKKAFFQSQQRVIFLSFIIHIALQLFGKRWQKLTLKENFYQMEHFLCM
jgi:hypothetical protein